MTSKSDTRSKSSKDELLVCSASECTEDQFDEDVLKCEKCERKVHYRCTMLPAYQIHRFKLAKTRQNAFICNNCICVDKRIIELVPNKTRAPSSQKVEKELEYLRRELEACQGQLKLYEEEKIVANARNKELVELKRKMDNNPALHTLEYVEHQIEAKMETFKESLEKTIKAELNIISTKSYAAAAAANSNKTSDPKQTTIKEAIKEALREEEAEENDKMKRSRNVIIHGLANQESKEDNAWVEELIKDTHSRIKIKSIVRLGKPLQDKKRPLLVCLSSEKEKSTLLGNLSSLKGIQKYTAVSITEDLTPGERRNLKELSNQAKERNKNDSTATEKWRVRGNSKNGFFLIKIKNKIPTQTNTQ